VTDRVLLVVHHGPLRQSLRDWLELELPRCAFIEAASAGEAVSLVQGSMPRLVVIDVDMPARAGLGAVQSVHAAAPAAPIVATGLEETGTYRAAVKGAGATAYVPKGTLQMELIPILRSVGVKIGPFPQPSGGGCAGPGLLCLRLLGGLQITLDETPLTEFISTKVPALLAYLAVTGRPHSRPALSGFLWGDTPERNAAKSLRTALYNLRQLLAPHLTVTRQMIAINQGGAYWLDVEVLTQRITEALRDNHGGLTHYGAALLEEAANLYRGDFLEGFYVRNAPAFEEWVLVQRERLRLLVLQALHVLVDYYTRQGQYAEAIDWARRLLVMEPWQEETHRQLMQVLALSGQRGAALAQYEALQRTLAEEFGVEPAEETRSLNRQIKFDYQRSLLATLRS